MLPAFGRGLLAGGRILYFEEVLSSSSSSWKEARGRLRVDILVGVCRERIAEKEWLFVERNLRLGREERKL